MKKIAVAGEHGAHARFVVDDALQFTRNREGNHLLVCAGGADGARIVAAMTCVYRDDHVARGLGRQCFCHGLDGLRTALRIQIQHQPIAELLGGRQQEALWPDAFGEIEYHAQIPIAMLATAHGLEQSIGFGGSVAGSEGAGLHVEHQAVGLLQLEYPVFNRS
jgi:hypothetical protein